MIENRPAFGIGVGRIYRLFGYYARDLGDLPAGMTFSAHSTFLNIGAELGLVGLLAWLGLLGTSLRAAPGAPPSGADSRRRAENGWTRRRPGRRPGRPHRDDDHRRPRHPL